MVRISEEVFASMDAYYLSPEKIAEGQREQATIDARRQKYAQDAVQLLADLYIDIWSGALVCQK